ncbi:hypothetical protein [Herbiconiux sp.]|uniref:hypothetical protein n=1 Tax=Herbiconiux sp. TaxID=1871186 RepID=UPI0025C03A72|nr:hypothetical protein [Herbiconiux sp.]
MAGKHAGSPEPEEFGESPHPEPQDAAEADVPPPPVVNVHRTGSRRVSTVPAPGSDPTPQATPESTPVRASEDTDEAWGSRPSSVGAAGPNDDRLKRDVPPHW